MSRNTQQIGHLIIHYGNDHALGRFIDIRDKRYEGTKKDEQGEGYVVEWSDIFQFSTNLIGITVEELLTADYDTIQNKADKFVTNNFKIWDNTQKI